MQEVRNDLKWADGKCVKHEVDIQLLDFLGPRTEADCAPVLKESKAKQKAPEKEAKKKSNQDGKIIKYYRIFICVKVFLNQFFVFLSTKRRNFKRKNWGSNNK